MAFLPNKSTNHSSPLPYLACLLPDVSMEIQQRLRFITNSVFLPLDLTLAFVSFLTNCLLLVAVARIKTRQHPSLILLCSLSVSDLLWAVTCLYRDIRVAIHEHQCPSSKEEEIYLAILCIFTTLSSLTVISKDRYRAVNKPRWYHNHMTKSRVLKEAFISWLSSVTATTIIYVVVTFLPEKFTFIKIIIAIIFCIACIFIIIGSYIGIFVAIRGHRRKNAPQYRVRPSVAALKREKKLAVTVGFILLALVFTFLPALVSPVILTLMGYRSKAPFRSIITVFINLNGLLNPMINCRRNEAIQSSLRQMFGRPCQARNVPRAVVVDVNICEDTSRRREDNEQGRTMELEGGQLEETETKAKQVQSEARGSRQ